MAKRAAGRVTVYDIAENLNISPSTVSRVLNNSNLISGEKTALILKEAERLGYQRRGIKKQVSRAILNIHLFLPETEDAIIHYFYDVSGLISSLHEGFGDVRIDFITRVNNGDLDFLGRKKSGQIDGCVFAFTEPGDSLAEILAEREIPYILLNRDRTEADYVCCDIERGIQFLADRLVAALGADIKPCFVGYKGLSRVSNQRFIAAAAAFRESGVVLDGGARYDAESFGDISEACMDWIAAGGFNAVMAFNDLAAVSILQGACRRGLRIPGDIALTGYDDSPIQELTGRRIDTIALPLDELGREAGAWLRKRIIDKYPVRLRQVLPAVYIPGTTIAEAAITGPAVSGSGRNRD